MLTLRVGKPPAGPWYDCNRATSQKADPSHGSRLLRSLVCGRRGAVWQRHRIAGLAGPKDIAKAARPSGQAIKALRPGSLRAVETHAALAIGGAGGRCGSSLLSRRWLSAGAAFAPDEFVRGSLDRVLEWL